MQLAVELRHDMYLRHWPPLAKYVYCSGHKMNLVEQEAFLFHHEGTNALKVLLPVVTFITRSPKHMANYKEFQMNDDSTTSTNLSL